MTEPISSSTSPLETRPAAIAGSFYDADPNKLKLSVDGFLNESITVETPDITPPKAIIVPHAGLRFSGSCAAKAYAKWKGANITRVVILGPAHRMAVQGAATSSATYWQTPLGKITLDREAIAAIEKLPFVKPNDAAHKEEHGLEVQLPFLQTILKEFTLIPIVFGQAEAGQVRQILETVWGGEETGIIISTDLSHFFPYEACNQIDNKTAKAVEAFDWPAIGRIDACGRIPLNGLLSMPYFSDSKRYNAEQFSIERLGLNNSGDTAGDKARVVGYGAWAVYDHAQPPQTAIKAPVQSELNKNELEDYDLVSRHGQLILQLAHQLLQFSVTKRQMPRIRPEVVPKILHEPRALFVTLEKQFRLRGCIGSLQATRPLIDDLSANVFAAAMKDHRFNPVTPDELQAIQLSLSLLSAPQPMEFKDEADLLSQLRPYKDGLIIEDQGKRATYLPQVWAQIPQAEAFLTSLKRKAGMAENHWSPTFTVKRYTALKLG